MNTITIKSENILKVINNFKKVLPMAKRDRQLDMSQSDVNFAGYPCGTIHCHAGWYAVASCDVLTKILTYVNGIEQMAKDLDIPYEIILLWASSNYEIWGNCYGSRMFNNRIAFCHPVNRPEGARNLQDIVDHWTEVYERVKIIELLSEPPVDKLIDDTLHSVKLYDIIGQQSF